MDLVLEGIHDPAHMPFLFPWTDAPAEEIPANYVRYGGRVLAGQGQGLGTRMRQTACALAFDHLGAERVTSSAFADNPSSLAVSRKVGYRPNGHRWLARRGEVAEQEALLLTPETFVRGEPIEVTGADALKEFTGLG